MDQYFMVKYIDSIIKPYENGSKCLLLFDELKAHKTELVYNHLLKLNIQPFLISAGHKYELQPLDVSINGPLKSQFRLQWEFWMAQSTTIFTKSGNRQKTKYVVSIQMINESIKQVTNQYSIKKKIYNQWVTLFSSNAKNIVEQ
jgi:hypothetical protein